MKIEHIAKICHEANKALCESNGDFSQASWLQAPAWQKGSVVAGVQHAMDNPEATPENSHESWLKMKEAEGWKYGNVKNPEIKRHPCMLPYDELPKEQRIKDELFLAICSILIVKIDKATPVIQPEDKKVNVDEVDAKVKMNPADEEAIKMDGVPKKKIPKKKTLPSGKAMPQVNK